MNFENAKERLLFHCGTHPNIEDERWRNGFLGHLRPFKGTLKEETFHDVMTCLKALADYFRESDQLDKQIISAISNILHLGRAWALDEDGMLRSNQLISEEDQKKMEEWLACISDCYCMLLDGCEDEVAFEPYEYLMNPED